MSMTEVEIVRLQNEVAALKARVDTLEKALLRGRRPVARSFAQRLGDPVADVKLHETHGTCDAERLDEQYGRLTCRFVKGHTGDHETKTGAQWGGPMSSATVSENCDRPPAGWACTRQRGHEGPCAAVPRDVVLVSEPSAGPRDRFNALAEKLVTGLVTYEAVRQALKDVFYEGRREGEGAAKEEWGEAIEEEDTTRAFRVLEILDDQDTRTEKEEYLAAAFAEVRAVAMRELGPRGYNIRWKDDGTTKFNEELERHRNNIEAMLNSRGITDNMITDVLWFLLAVAHQPGDK